MYFGAAFSLQLVAANWRGTMAGQVLAVVNGVLGWLRGY